MTKIIYKTGDAFMGEEKYLAHGCNAQGVMGTGFARQIKYHYPESYDYYRHLYKTIGLILGEVYDYTEKNRTILHCITQNRWGYNGVYVDYVALTDCMAQINEKYPNEIIAMPKIGAGFGGGDWDKISTIIEFQATQFQPVVYNI